METVKISLDPRNMLQGVDVVNTKVITSLNYGVRARHADLTTHVAVLSDEDLEFESTCGCSTTEKEKTHDGYSLKIRYNAEAVGNFGKTIKVKQAGQVIHEIVLRGTIVK